MARLTLSAPTQVRVQLEPLREPKMTVPLLDLDAQNEPLRERILQAIDGVIRAHAFILGPEVTRLEERMARYCGTPCALGVSSGTDALLASLMALGIGVGDQVITTAYSFFATAGAIARVGATPVFVDIDPRTFNLSPAWIEAAVTSRTKAILPVHLFGQCADMDPILDVARRYGLAVIEDAAQAIGAEHRGRRAGSMGDLGCFSFYPTKNLGAFGDAGMVVTHRRELAEAIRSVRVHGAEPGDKYRHRVVGGNFRLDTLQAAVLNVKLDYLDGWTRRRQVNARRYASLLATSGLSSRVALVLPESAMEHSGLERHHTFNQFVIRVPRRDDLREHLRAHGIGTEIYYPLPLHVQPCFSGLGHREGDFPEAERAAAQTLALPVYAELTEEQQSGVVDAIRDFYDG